MSRELFSRFQSEADFSPKAHRWVGNDENGFHVHGPIRLGEKFVDFNLQWKESKEASPREVGCFRFNLERLLDCGYIRKEKDEQIRLRFVHEDDGCIYIQRRDGEPRILIGKIDGR